MRIITIIAIAILLFASACGKDDDSPTLSGIDSSYGLVYDKIFVGSCALSGCHDGGNGAAYPSLKGDDVYESIFQAATQNGQAMQAGLQLVKANDVDSSFLYQKLIYDQSSFQFGSKMPLGGLTLTANQIEFVKQWIEAGAPKSGHVADRSLVE